MNEPTWLTLDVALAIHTQLLARFGGAEGVGDQGMLESALGKPQQAFASGEDSLFGLAASYAFGIVKNHPLVDGNQRTAFMAAYAFLGVNGLRLVAPEEEAVVHTLGLASSKVSESEFAAWLEKRSQPRG